MRVKQTILGAAAALAFASCAALAEPGLIYDLGGKFGRPLNESAYSGAQAWVEDSGGEYMEIELASEAQREPTLRRMAERGANPVIVLGSANGATLEKVAPDYPDTAFVIIDAVVDQPNVRSVVFDEHEGSYLAGMMAAMVSGTGTISFVGGTDLLPIHKIACGYAQGARAANPDIKVIRDMTSTTATARNDPVKGGDLTRAQISQGSDVVYAAAGGTGAGVLQTAAEEGILAIGGDSNQYHLHPGTMLARVVRRADTAVYDAFQAAAAGDLGAGMQVKGLKDDGVAVVIDEHNAELVTGEMRVAVEEAEQKIAIGEIEVHDYTTNDHCPA